MNALAIFKNNIFLTNTIVTQEPLVIHVVVEWKASKKVVFNCSQSYSIVAGVKADKGPCGDIIEFLGHDIAFLGAGFSCPNLCFDGFHFKVEQPSVLGCELLKAF